MKRALEYSAATIPDNFKTYLAALYQVQHAKGKKRKEFVKECSDAGLHFSARQLDRWVASLNSSGSAISTEKGSGQEKLLTREQRDVCSGWVLVKIFKGELVHLSTYCHFVRDHFGIDISDMTASNYLDEDGFSYRTVQKKNQSFTVDVLKLRRIHWNWVQRQTFPKNRAHLCSIDFTFTGHRTDKRSGFGIRGGASPMEATPISRFTNCIVTCLWADGKNRTPPMLFTYNPKFRRDRNPTALRTADFDHLVDCLVRYNIDPSRIQYIGKDKYETEVYAKECPDLVRRFFSKYPVNPNVTVLSDNGNSFLENGVSVIDSLGFKKHVRYEAIVHQYGSPNDNNNNGAAKQKWRASGVDYSDDVEASIRLLHYLDEDIIQHSKYYFDRNMLKLDEDGLENLIGWGSNKMGHLHQGWMRSYYISMGQDARGPREDLPDNLDDGLDGLYWL